MDSLITATNATKIKMYISKIKCLCVIILAFCSYALNASELSPSALKTSKQLIQIGETRLEILKQLQIFKFGLPPQLSKSTSDFVRLQNSLKPKKDLDSKLASKIQIKSCRTILNSLFEIQTLLEQNISQDFKSIRHAQLKTDSISKNLKSPYFFTSLKTESILYLLESIYQDHLKLISEACTPKDQQNLFIKNQVEFLKNSNLVFQDLHGSYGFANSMNDLVESSQRSIQYFEANKYLEIGGLISAEVITWLVSKKLPLGSKSLQQIMSFFSRHKKLSSLTTLSALGGLGAYEFAQLPHEEVESLYPTQIEGIQSNLNYILEFIKNDEDSYTDYIQLVHTRRLQDSDEIYQKRYTETMEQFSFVKRSLDQYGSLEVAMAELDKRLLSLKNSTH